MARKLAWIAVLVVAIVAAVVWQRQASREARIERAYASCMLQFGGTADPRSANPAAAQDAGSNPTLADSLGKAMQDLVKGVTAGMSGAVCGAVRDACNADFESAVCQNALAGFP
ncbi:MAG: hypothetical protein ABI585_03290 [Betaproteobacteria bacterium]